MTIWALIAYKVIRSENQNCANANAPVLLLDEPAEHVDRATADALTADLLAATTGRTTLVVTHRLTGLEAVDNVVVLDAGGVVEQGNHAALIAQDGPYRRMWDRERAALDLRGVTLGAP